MKRKKFSYDEYSDSLIISNRNESEVVKDNFEIGDMIFSLSDEGKVLSIEIRGFSNFLESCEIDSAILKSMKNVELKIIPKREMLFLVLKMETFDGSSVVYHDIPLIMPLINQEKHSYRRALVSA
ncbi:DUF2283 domain-containing protein [Candidatus Pacearchaeota archaeon]|nr:DUF2283 domain-containing protein [Candidatus Pacearchaeota archaeon]